MAAGLLLTLAALLLRPAAGLRAGQPTRPPKVFYLFLAGDGVFHEEIWADFFSQGARGVDYEAFIHCTDRRGCVRNIKHRELFTKVKTVPSSYCRNLVDPMLALLEAAYNASGPDEGGVDKFVYVSHNSLPVKPFAVLQRNLTEGQAGLATFSVVQSAGCYKASQWSVLSRAHASRLLDFARQPRDRQSRWGCLRTEAGRTLADRALAARSHRCPDEHWPLLAIFGRRTSSSSVPDPKLMPTLRNRQYMWVDWMHPEFGGHSRITLARQGTDAAWKDGGNSGPATVLRFTRPGLKGLSKSPFLFMRKVLPNTTYEDGSSTLREAFRRLVLGL